MPKVHVHRAPTDRYAEESSALTSETVETAADIAGGGERSSGGKASSTSSVKERTQSSPTPEADRPHVPTTESHSKKGQTEDSSADSTAGDRSKRGSRGRH